MDISLNDNEIKQALKNFVNTLGIDTNNKQIDIKLTVGRKKQGSSAEVSITNNDTDIVIEKTVSEVVSTDIVDNNKEPEEKVDSLDELEEEEHNPETTNVSGGSLFNND